MSLTVVVEDNKLTLIEEMYENGEIVKVDETVAETVEGGIVQELIEEPDVLGIDGVVFL